jgi:hypothetical protein
MAVAGMQIVSNVTGNDLVIDIPQLLDDRQKTETSLNQNRIVHFDNESRPTSLEKTKRIKQNLILT